jgi:hypothetical protein
MDFATGQEVVCNRPPALKRGGVPAHGFPQSEGKPHASGHPVQVGLRRFHPRGLCTTSRRHGSKAMSRDSLRSVFTPDRDRWDLATRNQEQRKSCAEPSSEGIASIAGEDQARSRPVQPVAHEPWSHHEWERTVSRSGSTAFAAFLSFLIAVSKVRPILTLSVRVFCERHV